MEVDGVNRQYTLYVPEGHDGTEKWPLVFAFHGLTANNQAMIIESKMYSVADTAKFLVVYPQGLIVNCKPLGVVDLGWNIPDNFEADQDDVAFVGKIITILENNPSYGIDLNKVYATGGSNGGILSVYLAFELAHRIAAVADVSGPISDMLINHLCVPSRPVSVLHMQGTDDFLIPSGGNEYFLPLEAVTEYWAGISGCNAVPDSTELEDLNLDDNSTVTLFEYNNCESDYEVLLYRINGGGHVWPGGDLVPGDWDMGNINMDINGSAEIWNFFKRNTRPVQFVQISDTAFLHALVDQGVDINSDSLISYNEAETVISLSVDSVGISDMTGIEAFINLNSLSCSYNLIPNLDVSDNYALTHLNCSFNHLYSLDLSQNTALVNLNCSANQLSSLDVSKNTALKNLSMEGMLDLREVCVWEMPFPPTSASVLITGSPNAFFSIECSVNNVSIPDTDFLNALIDERIDTNGDSLISYAEARNEDDLVLYGGRTGGEIRDATGIEAFTNLKHLVLRCNKLTSLDLSNNQELTYLDVGENFLETLDISGCHLLTTLKVGARSRKCGYKNLIKSLDITNNKLLVEIDLLYLDSLRGVCVWTMPFPPDGVTVYKGPNIYFTKECSDLNPPIITAVDSQYQTEFLEAKSTEDGMIYLVPIDTEKDLAAICGVCLDSVVAVANSPTIISLSGLENGTYWLYARDFTGNISDPKAITIMGVGIQQSKAGFIRLYPNPTNTLLTIETKYSDHYSIEITSLNGQEIYTAEMQGTSHQVDLSSFQKGIYFITIRSKEFVSTRKIVKL